MTKKLLTLDQLWTFCKDKKFTAFSADESGYKLAVQVPAVVKFEEDVDRSKDGLMFLRVRVCHIGINRNHSKITEENMIKAMPSLKYRPVLAAIHELDDGTMDFHGHDMEIDEDGNIVYIEQPVGTFTEKDPILEYNADYDKTYVIAEAAISEDYSCAADIIRRKNGTKVSCELLIDNMQFDTSDNVLNLIDFRFSGCVLLGSETDGKVIEEGMLGSRADIMDFSENNNSVFADLLYKIEELNNKVDTLVNSDTTKEGGNRTVGENMNEEITVAEEVEVNEATEEVTNEEVRVEEAEETPVVDNFEEEDAEAEHEDIEDEAEHSAEEHEPEPEGTHPVEEHEDDEEVIDDDEPIRVQNSMTRSFEISHDDIRYGLYNLLAQYEETDNDWFSICKVYDSHFIFESWVTGKFFGQKYTVEGDSVALDGDRYDLFAEFLTVEEKASLDAMRSSYENLQAELSQYKAKEENLAKDNLFAEYAAIAEDEAVVALKADHSKFTYAELKDELDALLLKAAKSGALNFAQREHKVRTIAFASNFEADDKERKPYGGIFEKYKKK